MQSSGKNVLGECHAHLAMDALNYKTAMARHENEPDEAHIRRCFESYRDCGIAFVRDGGDKYGVSSRAKQIAPEYGIDYRTPIFAIHKNGTYGGIVGRGFDTMADYAALVEEACRMGADFIKIMTTGIMDFDVFGRIVYGEGLAASEVRDMVRIAHEHGRAVMVHVNGARAVQVAAEAGADSVEHANYLDADAVKALAEHGTCLVPTMAVAHNLRGRGLYDEGVLERICSMEREGVRAAWEAGVTIACGSDAGAVGVPHGRGALDERACIAKAIGDERVADECLARGQSLIERTFRRQV